MGRILISILLALWYSKRHCLSPWTCSAKSAICPYRLQGRQAWLPNGAHLNDRHTSTPQILGFCSTPFMCISTNPSLRYSGETGKGQRKNGKTSLSVYTSRAPRKESQDHQMRFLPQLASQGSAEHGLRLLLAPTATWKVRQESPRSPKLGH